MRGVSRGELLAVLAVIRSPAAERYTLNATFGYEDVLVACSCVEAHPFFDVRSNRSTLRLSVAVRAGAEVPDPEGGDDVLDSRDR